MKLSSRVLFAVGLSAVFSLTSAGSLVAKVPTKAEAKKALEENPDDLLALYNFGLTSYLDNEYPAAIKAWSHLCELDKSDWQVKAKLVQAYTANGQKVETEKMIKALRGQWASGKIEALNKQEFYIRDQFVVGKSRVFTLEYFELKGDRPLLWKFLMRTPGKEHKRHFSVGSYPSTTAVMRSSGSIGPEERGFHLDGYWANGDHETFGFYKGKPDYDLVKKQVAEILKGERDNISSTVSGTPSVKEGKKTDGE